MLTDEGVEALRPERGVDAVLHALHRRHQTPLAVPGRRVAHWLSSLSAAGMSASRSCGASSRRATAATAPKASARPYPRLTRAETASAATPSPPPSGATDGAPATDAGARADAAKTPVSSDRNMSFKIGRAAGRARVCTSV